MCSDTSYPTKIELIGKIISDIESDVWFDYHMKKEGRDKLYDIIHYAGMDFPFTDGQEGTHNVMRMKGYYSIAVPPYISEVIRRWFNKWFGELEHHTSPTTVTEDEN